MTHPTNLGHNEQADDRDEAPLEALRGYDLSVEPQRDLWPGIEARIAPRRKVSANAWMSMAAAACVATVVGLTVLRPLPPAPAATQDVAMAEMTTPDLQAVPGGRALVKANLQLAKQSEQQIRKALAQDPDSAALHRLLLTTQTRSDELRRMLAAQST